METSLLMEKSKSEEIPREKKKKKVAAMGYFSLDPSSLTTGGPVVLLVCGLRGKIISECGASCLRTFMS